MTRCNRGGMIEFENTVAAPTNAGALTDQDIQPAQWQQGLHQVGDVCDGENVPEIYPGQSESLAENESCRSGQGQEVRRAHVSPGGRLCWGGEHQGLQGHKDGQPGEGEDTASAGVAGEEVLDDLVPQDGAGEEGDHGGQEGKYEDIDLIFPPWDQHGPGLGSPHSIPLESRLLRQEKIVVPAVRLRLSPAREYLNARTEYEDRRGPRQPGGVEGFDVDEGESQTDGWRSHPDSQPATNSSV